jgi:2-hydroxy-3-oxopropionate reductase
MAGTIGFIGLGLMGKPMARNLMKAGHTLVVHNIPNDAAEELGREGATVARNAREVAEQSDVIITMLPDSPDVFKVVTGENGILEGIKPGTLYIDMSSISPVVTTQLEERVRAKGARMVDAPVSGGDVGAINATLSIMVGGEEADFEAAKPYFTIMGKTIVHVGPSGAGQVVKAANQVVVGITMAAVAEALLLAAKGGVKAEKVLDVLGGGLAGNKVMEVKREKYLNHDFTPGFRAELHHKDMGIAMSAAREYGLVLPFTALTDQMFNAMKQKGWGKEDHSGILRVLEDLSGYQINE